MSETCVLLIGHGSRDPNACTEIETLAAAYRATHPEFRVEVAYIELAAPLLAEALRSIGDGVRRIVVVPLFLFASGHVKNDIPLAVSEARRLFPRVKIAVAPCLGVHPLLTSLAYDRASGFLPKEERARQRAVLVVVGRGSSDPDANGDFYKVARLIGEGRGLAAIEPAFSGIARPSVPEALEAAARQRPELMVVLPYLLFTGRLVSRLEEQARAFAERHSWIRVRVAPHLGSDPRLSALVHERVRQALSGELLLPCDTCQYRTPFVGREEHVGGLRALLYSVRHTLTHSQAAMPVHAHRPLKKHVLVCGNTDCVDRGSIGVLEALRRDVKAAGHTRDIRITRTACLGRCGEGPTVAVYPDGVWYRQVGEADAKEIVGEHLLADRLVGRLVGDILN